MGYDAWGTLNNHSPNHHFVPQLSVTAPTETPLPAKQPSIDAQVSYCRTVASSDIFAHHPERHVKTHQEGFQGVKYRQTHSFSL